MTRRHIIKQQQEQAQKRENVRKMIEEQQSKARRANPYAAKHAKPKKNNG